MQHPVRSVYTMVRLLAPSIQEFTARRMHVLILVFSVTDSECLHHSVIVPSLGWMHRTRPRRRLIGYTCR